MTWLLRPFNNISVISGRWEDDNERLCAMEPRLRLKRFSYRAGIEPAPLDQEASTYHFDYETTSICILRSGKISK